MNPSEMQVVIDRTIATLRGKRLDDGSLSLTFVHRAMALCLAYTVNTPATFSRVFGDLSTYPVLEGHLAGNFATRYFLGNWMEDMAMPAPGFWYVQGLGFFDETSAALMAKAKVAGRKELVLLIRYLREEVLVTRTGENGGAALPPRPRRQAAAPVAPAPSPSSMTSQIRGLRRVLTTLCEAFEARVAELPVEETEKEDEEDKEEATRYHHDVMGPLKALAGVVPRELESLLDLVETPVVPGKLDSHTQTKDVAMQCGDGRIDTPAGEDAASAADGDAGLAPKVGAPISSVASQAEVPTPTEGQEKTDEEEEEEDEKEPLGELIDALSARVSPVPTLRNSSSSAPEVLPTSPEEEQVRLAGQVEEVSALVGRVLPLLPAGTGNDISPRRNPCTSTTASSPPAMNPDVSSLSTIRAATTAARTATGAIPTAVPEVPLASPTTVADASAAAGGGGNVTTRGGPMDGLLGSGVEPDSGDSPVPALEATADSGGKNAFEDDSLQAKGMEDSAGEALRKLTSELVQSVVEAAVGQRVSAIVGVGARAAGESKVAHGEHPQGGRTMLREEGETTRTPRCDSSGSTGLGREVPHAILHRSITVADAAGEGTDGTATSAVIGGGAEEVKGGEGVGTEPGGMMIRRLEISEEERKQAGAPQGDIFEAVLLQTVELQASSDVSIEVQVLRTLYEADEWSARFGAVSAARVLLTHHPEVFGGGGGVEDGGLPGLLGVVSSLVAGAASDKRSVLRTNALRCMAELFSCDVGRALSADSIDALVKPALACHKLSVKVSRDEADKAMDAAVAHANLVLLLNAILSQAFHDHPKVVNRAVQYVGECLSRLEVGEVPGNGVPDGLGMKSLVLALARGAASRASDVKDAAWTALERCRKALKTDAFESAVKKHAGAHEARTIHDLLSTKSRQRERATAAATLRSTRASGRRKLPWRRDASGGGDGGGGAAAKGGSSVTWACETVVDMAPTTERTTPVESETAADGGGGGGGGGAAAAAGLVPNDGAPILSVASPAVLPTPTAEEKEEEKKPACEPIDARFARVESVLPLPNSSSSAPEVLPTPSEDEQIRLARQINEVSAMVGRLLPLLPTGTGNETSPRWSPPASTTASSLPATLPDVSNLSVIRAAINAARTARKNVEAATGGSQDGSGASR